jgi:hypothetical protein
MVNMPNLALGGPSLYMESIPLAGDAEQVEKPANTNTVVYWVVIFAALMLLKYTSNRRDDMTPSILGIGVYNFLAVTLMAIFGIVGMKVIFNKYKVPGMTELVNAV